MAAGFRLATRGRAPPSMVCRDQACCGRQQHARPSGALPAHGRHSSSPRRWLLNRRAACTAASASRTAEASGPAFRASSSAWNAFCHATPAATHSWPAADGAAAGRLAAAVSAASAAASCLAAVLAKEAAAAAHASADPVRASAAAGVTQALTGGHGPASNARGASGGGGGGGAGFMASRVGGAGFIASRWCLHARVAFSILSHVAWLTLQRPCAVASTTSKSIAAAASACTSSLPPAAARSGAATLGAPGRCRGARRPLSGREKLVGVPGRQHEADGSMTRSTQIRVLGQYASDAGR